MRTGLFKTTALTLAFSLGAAAQTKPGLDTTTFVVMGEGLAAGMGNFGLSTEGQKYSFPAQVAAQLKTAFPQPLIQPPGIGNVVGYPEPEVRLQTYPQGSVRQFYQPDVTKASSPPLFVLNVSVPGQTLADSLSMRPVSPIAQRNMKQTTFNLLLGFPQLFLDNVPLWTQFEYAKAVFPSVTMIELGYYEVLDAAATGDFSRLPSAATFGGSYGTVVQGFRNLQSQVIVCTIPNPLDTAYFSSPAVAADINALSSVSVFALYGVTPPDYISRTGLYEIGSQIANIGVKPLSAGSILTADKAATLTAAVNGLNSAIIAAAKANGAVVYDLNAYLHSVRLSGASIGNSTVTADYLGGFYSLDGAYPSPTGNALIANDVIKFLNSTYQKSFTSVSVSAVAAVDSAVQARRPSNIARTLQSGLLNSGDSIQ